MKKPNVPRSPDGPDDPRKPGRGPGRSFGWIIVYMILLFAFLWYWRGASGQMGVHTIPYSQFKAMVGQGMVTNVVIGANVITGQVFTNAVPKEKSAQPNSLATAAQELESTNNIPSSTNFFAASSFQSAPPDFQVYRVDDPNLVHDLQMNHIAYAGSTETSNAIGGLLLAWIVPIVILFFLWRFLARRMTGLGQSVLGFGSSRAKMMAEQSTKVTFHDVAGCDEAKHDLQEVVAFLKNPKRYDALGATIPKGILLIGPPGTGKTLLARAVAGEAQVPFFFISGSDFVEMFVGVGAARVRDLFEKAKSKAPCIVFIDELDAVGRQRGVRIGAVNDEREQTLNQLLVGMDGFEPNAGIIILAATNRPEILDPALLRPGRFDRHVVVDVPDLDGRLAILKIHSRGKRLAADVDLRKVAAQTPGLAGADLANVINEAALAAATGGAEEVTQLDLENAVERVVAGPERRSRRLSDEEKTRVAYHETGHALVAFYSKHADPVHKISIIPRGRAALGYTMQLPTRDVYLMSKSALLDRIRVLLGGRAAEEVVFKEISTGAENDLQQATGLARQMVAMFGMSERVGLAYCARREGYDSFLPNVPAQRDCSEETAREIDEEVKKILDAAYAEARTLLQIHRQALEQVAHELLEREMMDAKTFKELVAHAEPAIAA